MFDSPIIDVAIGLVLLFWVLATIVSAITESIARFLGLRGEFLLRGLRALVDGTPEATGVDASQTPAAAGVPASGTGPASAAATTTTSGTAGTLPPPAAQASTLTALLGTPVLSNHGALRSVNAKSAGTGAKLSLADKRSLPSYLASRTFAAGVLDLLIPNGSNQTTMTGITTAIEGLGDGLFKSQLSNIAKASTGHVDKFRENLEAWYDDHMDRVSGWYKRYTRWITVLVGAVLVIGLNLQIFSYAQNLYTDQALGQTVATHAVAASQCQSKEPTKCLEQARQQLQDLQPGLQIGWAETAACQGASAKCNFFEAHGATGPVLFGGSPEDLWFGLTILLEWVLTVLALIPGARFWFDLVNQFSSLRSSGPKPARSTQGA